MSSRKIVDTWKNSGKTSLNWEEEIKENGESNNIESHNIQRGKALEPLIVPHL